MHDQKPKKARNAYENDSEPFRVREMHVTSAADGAQRPQVVPTERLGRVGTPKPAALTPEVKEAYLPQQVTTGGR